jgi:hypothetical protein
MKTAALPSGARMPEVMSMVVPMPGTPTAPSIEYRQEDPDDGRDSTRVGYRDRFGCAAASGCRASRRLSAIETSRQPSGSMPS